MTWRWTFDPEGGSGDFGSREDAETWLSESWRDLAAEGVAAVTLHEDGTEVYGPMSLDPA